VVVIAAGAAFAQHIASFENLTSVLPVVVTVVALALAWQLAILRGVLQGLHRFAQLAMNSSVELAVRSLSAAALLLAGFAVGGAMAAVMIGLLSALVLALLGFRDRLSPTLPRAPAITIGTFSVSAVVGIIGIQVLFSQDVILAKHYLSQDDAGIYASINKTAALVFFLTLSVSQVLFPRVVRSINTSQSPGHLLLGSVSLLVGIGGAGTLAMGLQPGLLIAILYGPAFASAVPYVFIAGLIGLALSVDNLLVQFLMAAHDLFFIPILVVGCVAELFLIAEFHGNVGQVVASVLTPAAAMAPAFGFRCWLVSRHLRGQFALKTAATLEEFAGIPSPLQSPVEI